MAPNSNKDKLLRNPKALENLFRHLPCAKFAVQIAMISFFPRSKIRLHIVYLSSTYITARQGISDNIDHLWGEFGRVAHTGMESKWYKNLLVQ